MNNDKLFGTFGFRGTAGIEINTFLVWLTVNGYVDAYNPRKIVVGRDVRMSGESFKKIVIGTLMEKGIDVIDVGELPTPALQFAVRQYGADGGIMITASHNPPEYNGIKIVDGNGVGVSREKAIDVENKMKRILMKLNSSPSFRDLQINLSDVTNGNRYRGRIEKKNAIVDYINNLTKYGPDLKGVRVVFDGSSSVGARTIPVILRKLGARVFTVNSVEDPEFKWRNPEPSPENIAYLQRIVVDAGADIGIAVDGDGDRTIIIDENGRILPGDKTFAIIADYVLENVKLNGWNKGVVTTVATSDIIYDIARKHDAKVVTTKVGDPYVSQVALDKKFIIGGEENGGVIFPWWVPGRDSGMTVVMIMHILNLAKVNATTLSTLVDNLPTYYQVKIKYPGRIDYAEAEKSVMNAGFNYDKTDGIKIRTDFGWILIRNSGTEPVVRIFAESKNEKDLDKLLEIGKSLVKRK